METTMEVVEARRKDNRTKFPKVTEFVDAMREAFPDADLKVRWAYEDGNEVGSRPPHLTDADLQATNH